MHRPSRCACTVFPIIDSLRLLKQTMLPFVRVAAFRADLSLQLSSKRAAEPDVSMSLLCRPPFANGGQARLIYMSCSRVLPLSCLLTLVPVSAFPCTLSPSPMNIQRPALSEKESRTPAQQKINSQILYEIYRKRGQAAEKQVPPGETGVRLDKKGRALVDVRAEVSPKLQKRVRSLGGTIVSTSREHHTIIAWAPLLKLEQLATDPAVRAIEPAAEATIR